MMTRFKSISLILTLGGLLLCACTPQNESFFNFYIEAKPTPTIITMPGRPLYNPGELVEYQAQTGDTLPALAVHFNTTVKEILEANPIIPAEATTLPAGLPMEIPIYYLPLWGSSYKIIPDSLFINGPAQIGFDTSAFVDQQPGWLKNYSDWAAGENRSGAEVVDYVALNYSVSPRLLLAILEYQSHALSEPDMPKDNDYPLGYKHYAYKGLYRQLSWAADVMNNGYYGWRTGRLNEFEHLDKRIERPDPWQNAATVGLQYYYSRIIDESEYDRAISNAGVANTYQELFGDPWANEEAHIPGSLQQPEFKLPFLPGRTWSFTGGPHTAWGNGDPYSALDFAPPSDLHGCFETKLYATALADGIIARTETGIAVLDLDGDGDERTGWAIFYLHLATRDRVQKGDQLKTGDPVGHPSCERGSATGTHVHIARKYNGEWIPADSPVPFNLEGWIAHNGDTAYEGTLTRQSLTVVASAYSDQTSFIHAGNEPATTSDDRAESSQATE